MLSHPKEDGTDVFFILASSEETFYCACSSISAIEPLCLSMVCRTAGVVLSGEDRRFKVSVTVPRQSNDQPLCLVALSKF